MMLDRLDRMMLEQVAGLHAVPAGAYSIRKNGRGEAWQSSASIEITSRPDRSGIDVFVKPGTRDERVDIPVILTQEGLTDIVTNTFDIGEQADVLIVAGCGIHNPGEREARHDGHHQFRVGRGASLRYVEKHLGEGPGEGRRILNPTTELVLAEDARVELELVQVRGIDRTNRITRVRLAAGSHLSITERLLTEGLSEAESVILVDLDGPGCSARVMSRSVARDRSRQSLRFRMTGSSRCRGHVQCDAIVMDEAQVSSSPEISACSSEAQLVHEAAIGRIENEQLVKLMTLGLTAQEAETAILAGFLR